MNTFLFLTVIVALLSVILIQPTDAHSSKHVRSLCKRKAVRHIRKLCPDMCLTGELINVFEYCSMGYSDSQVKHMCCPE